MISIFVEWMLGWIAWQISLILLKYSDSLKEQERGIPLKENDTRDERR